MKTMSVGDLAHSFLMRRQTSELKTELTRLSEELGSGRTSDTASHLGGHFTALAEFERELVLLGRQSNTAVEAGVQADAMQTALDGVQTRAGELGSTLALAASEASQGVTGLVAAEAESALNQIISTLNVNSAGRTVFAGVAVSTAPLADAATLLADLSTAIAGSTTAADVLAAADAYFDTPGGDFETNIYQGDTVDLSPFDLGSGETVTLSLRADNDALRTVLKNVAVAALIEDAGIALDANETKSLLGSLVDGAFTGQDQVTQLRAQLGFAEERIEAASARIVSELTSVEYARNSLVDIDPFRTATELQSVQTQLEMLYTITARNSRLSLMNFLS